MERAERILRINLELRVCSGHAVCVGQHAVPDRWMLHGPSKEAGPCGRGDAVLGHRDAGESFRCIDVTSPVVFSYSQLHTPCCGMLDFS